MIRSSSFKIATAAATVALAALCLTATETVGDWKIAGPFGGTATSVAVDPSDSKIVLAGAMNSLLFKSKDAGDNWAIVNFPKRHLSALTSILIDPSDSQHYLVGVIAADGGGLYESHNAGEKWAVVKGLERYGVRALAFSASQPSRFLAGTQTGVMMSDDSGKTWARISDPNNSEMAQVTAVAVDVKDPNIMYAGTSHLPWKSSDGGKTWTSIHTGMIDDSDVFSIYVDPANPASILASACSGIYASPDRGDAWHKLLGIPNTSRRTHIIREDPTNSATIYAGTTMGLFKSATRGTTWKTLTTTQVNWLTFDPAKPQGVYLALDDEGLAKSDNGGESIKPINNGFVDRVIGAVATSGKKLIAIQTQEGSTTGIFVSADRGETWTQMRESKSLAGVHLKAVTGVSDDEKTLLAASPNQMYKSLDSGATWKPIPIKLVTMPPPVEPAKIAPSPKPKPSVKGKATTHARVVHIAKPLKPKALIKIVYVSEVSGLYSIKSGAKNIFFAATDLGLLRSDDMAQQWTLAEIPGSSAITGLYLKPDASAIIARAANGLFISKDGGDYWSPMSFPLPSADINDIALSADESAPVLVATRVGLYSSNAEGDKWTVVSNGLPASTVGTVLYAGADKTAYVVEYGRLYQSKDAGVTWAEIVSALPPMRIRQLWKADTASNRIYGLTSDLGIIYRD